MNKPSRPGALRVVAHRVANVLGMAHLVGIGRHAKPALRAATPATVGKPGARTAPPRPATPPVAAAPRVAAPAAGHDMEAHAQALAAAHAAGVTAERERWAALLALPGAELNLALLAELGAAGVALAVARKTIGQVAMAHRAANRRGPLDLPLTRPSESATSWDRAFAQVQPPRR